MSLFRKMFLPILGAAALSLSFTGIVQYRAAEEVMQFSNLQLGNAMAEELTRSLDILVSQIRRQMVMLATSDQTIRLLLSENAGAPAGSTDAEPAARVRERLAHTTETLGSVRTMTLLDATGKVVGTSESVGLGTQRGDRRYFQEAMRGLPAQQGPIIGRSSGQPVYVLAQPVKSENRVLGVVMAAVSLEYLNRTLVDPIRLDRNGHMYVLAPTGQVIMHPDRRQVFSHDWLDGATLAAVHTRRSGTLERTSPDGPPVPAAYVTLADPGWIVIFEDSRRQATAALTAMRNASLWTTGLVLLAVLAFLSFSLLSIIRALRKTARFAEAVAAGDLDRTLDIRRKDEIGALAGALTAMVANLKQEITLAARRSREAEQATAELKSIIDGIDGGVAKIRLDGAFTVLWGSDGFYRLYGCTQRDFAEYMAGQPFKAVHPDDVDTFRALLGNDAPASPLALTYRVRRRDGSTVWLNVRAVVIGSDEGYPVVQGVFTDVSQQKRDAQSAELERTRYRIVAGLSRDVPFEYDIASDIMHYSGQYQPIFGQTPDVPHFSRAIARRGIIHPDEQAAVLALLTVLPPIDAPVSAFPTQEPTPEVGTQQDRAGTMRETMSVPPVKQETQPEACPQTWMDIRLRNILGQYTWYRLFVTILRDPDGHPLKTVGKLTCIQKQKDHENRQRERTQRDDWTTLLRRDSAEAEIRTALAARPEGRHALLVVELDDFQAVTEQYGAPFGDDMLRSTADSLRDTFRRTDILGCFGKNAFVALVRDVPPGLDGTARLRERIERFYQKTAAWKHADAPDHTLSVSMGVVLYEGDGRSLEDLFRMADNALRQAQRSAKGSFAGV